MPHEQTDDLVGVPSMSPAKRAIPNSVAKASHDNNEHGRNAADEPIPLGAAVNVTEVSLTLQEKRDSARVKAEQERQLRELQRGHSERNKRAFGTVLRKVIVSSVLLVGGLGGLLLWTQLIQAVATISAWPFLPWLAAVVTLAVALFLIAVSVARLLWFVAKFRQNRPVTRLTLEQRAAMREAAQRVDLDGKKWLGNYMKDYPVDAHAHEAFLQRWGVEIGDREIMKRARENLLDRDNRQDVASWQQSFADSFLGPLDKASRRIVKEYATVTAVKTAVCPYALLDMAVVIYMGAGMIGSLCRLYQLRSGQFDTIYLFGLVLGQAFFADWAEEHSSDLEGWTDGVFDHIGDSVVPGLAADLIGKTAVKASQGITNAMLLNRIGRQACCMLRPMN